MHVPATPLGPSQRGFVYFQIGCFQVLTLVAIVLLFSNVLRNFYFEFPRLFCVSFHIFSLPYTYSNLYPFSSLTRTLQVASSNIQTPLFRPFRSKDLSTPLTYRAPLPLITTK